MPTLQETGSFVPPEPYGPDPPPFHFKEAPRWVQIAAIIVFVALGILAIFLLR